MISIYCGKTLIEHIIDCSDLVEEAYSIFEHGNKKTASELLIEFNRQIDLFIGK